MLQGKPGYFRRTVDLDGRLRLLTPWETQAKDQEPSHETTLWPRFPQWTEGAR